MFLQQLEVALKQDFIPKYKPAPQQDTPILFSKADQLEINKRIRKLAVEQRLNRVEKDYITSDDVENIYAMLLKIGTPIKSQVCITYSQFCSARSTLPTRLKGLFKPTIFLSFPKIENEFISVQVYYQFIKKVVFLVDAKFTLVNYAKEHQHFITDDELEQYLTDIFPQLNLPQMSPGNKKFYVCHALRKFSFYHDRMRQGKMSIDKIVYSSTLAQLMEIRDNPDLKPQELETNWFSAQVFAYYYSEFKRLDVDQNGTISRKEISQFRNGNLTKSFLDRVYQTVQLYNNEMVF
jgi:hypothetical protein